MRTPLLALALATPLLAQDQVWVVDAGGGADATDVQSALALAAPGDTILVRAGTYPGFTLSQPAQVVAEAGARPEFTSLVQVLDLTTLGEEAVLSGLDLDEGLRVMDCVASVLVEDCWIVPATENTEFIERPTSRVVDSEHVTFTACILRGRDGAYKISCHDGNPGEHALQVSGVNTKVALYASTVVGGDGGTISGCGHYPWIAGHGGHGLELLDGAFVYGEGNTTAGGVPGINESWDNNEGNPGDPVYTENGATWTVGTHAPLTFRLATVASEDQAVNLRLEGPAGATAFVLAASQGWPRYLGPEVGFLHLASPLTLTPVGTLPASGVLEVPWGPFPLTSGEFEVQRLQFYANLAGKRMVGAPRALTVLAAGL